MKVKGNLMKKTYQITEKGKGDLEVELADLKSRRGEIAEKIAVARDFGDLRENAEYDAAKEAQGLLEMKISKLLDTIANSKIIEEDQIDTSKVSILTTVKLKNNATKVECPLGKLKPS